MSIYKVTLIDCDTYENIIAIVYRPRRYILSTNVNWKHLRLQAISYVTQFKILVNRL